MASVLSIVIAKESAVAKTDWIETKGVIASVERQFLLDYGRQPSWVVVFTYKADGHYYSGTLNNYSYDAPLVGETLTLRYDPSNPDRNDLVEKNKRAKWIGAGIFVLGLLLWQLLRFIN
jgi:Protein of unknown function (DUF3592)